VNGPRFEEVLASRRMCRDFQESPVGEHVLTPVLAAAFRGPAAGNTAGLDLVVLEGPSTEEYWDITLPDTGASGPRGRFRWPGLLRAPVLVIPVVDPGAYVERYAEPDKAGTGLGAGEDRWTVPYWWVDGGAAVMGMLLAAESAGLGALLFGQFGHEPRVAESFGIPAGCRPLGTVALGWPAGGGRRPSASARRGRPRVEDRLHRGRW
jgi:nitroreductase